MNTANLVNMANLTIFRQRPNFKRMSSRQGYQQSGEYGKFDDISPRTKIQGNELKGTNKAANSTNTANLASLMIFRQRPKFKRMSSRQGYQQTAEFDEYGEFGKFDDISPKTTI